MSVDVYVYDDLMAPLKSAVDMLESDHAGTVVDSKTSRHLGKGEYGEKLILPSPLVPVEVFLDEPTGLYAPTTLKHFNTTVKTIRLDVSLFPLPTSVSASRGGSGGGRSSSAAGGGGLSGPPPGGISKFITSKVQISEWTVEQSVGVASLAEAVLGAKTLKKLDDQLKPRLKRWCDWLRDLGIDPDIFGTDVESDPWNFSGGGGVGSGPLKKQPQSHTKPQKHMGSS